MENSLTEITGMINGLSIKGGDVAEYECLLSLLNTLEISDIRRILRKCDFMKLFAAMNLQEGKVMDVALKLANKLFSGVPLVELIAQHEPEVMQALEAENPELTMFVLEKLKAGISGTSTADFLTENVLSVIIRLAVHDDLRIAKSSVSFLSDIATEIPGGIHKVFGASSVARFVAACNRSEYALRISELAADVSVKVPKHFEVIRKSGVLDILLTGLLERDPLIVLNFIEVTKKILVLPDGYDWIPSALLNGMLSRLAGWKNDPTGRLILPGFFAFFGCVASLNPLEWLAESELKKENSFLRTLKDAVEDSDPSVVLAAAEPICSVCHKKQGRRELKKHLIPSGALFPLIVRLGHFLRESPTTVILPAVAYVSQLIRQPDDITNALEGIEQTRIALEWTAYVARMGEVPSDRTLDIGEQLLSVGKLLKRLMTLAANPFIDVRLAALQALGSMSSQPWGVRVFVDQPGFMKYLLDRKTEAGLAKTAVLMQMKYEIVQGILCTMEQYTGYDTTDFSVLLSPEQMLCLKLYIKEGIWGIQSSDAAVAMEPG
ncbi:unnamed protein product [Dicrocoelium dendriticum]|nr:unnamed protein product [Dicrocoelium dendriticum]